MVQPYLGVAATIDDCTDPYRPSRVSCVCAAQLRFG